jgi:hypothetical protein
VAIVAAVILWCLKLCCFWVWYLLLDGDDKDDGLDGALEVWCEVLQSLGLYCIFFFYGVVCNRFRY